MADPAAAERATGYALLDGLGLDVATTLEILMTLQTYVMGAVLRRRGWQDPAL
jgi:hypothetical protein